MNKPVMLHGPAWWCQRCQAWWPGSWFAGFDNPTTGEPPADEPDEDAANAYRIRTCAECGEDLVPRARPLRLVRLRGIGETRT